MYVLVAAHIYHLTINFCLQNRSIYRVLLLFNATPHNYRIRSASIVAMNRLHDLNRLHLIVLIMNLRSIVMLINYLRDWLLLIWDLLKLIWIHVLCRIGIYHLVFFQWYPISTFLSVRIRPLLFDLVLKLGGVCVDHRFAAFVIHEMIRHRRIVVLLSWIHMLL